MGLGMNYTDWGIREVPVLTGLSAFTLLMCGVAYYRRLHLPEAEAFEVTVRTSISTLKTEFMEETDSKADKILASLVIISMLVSLGSLAYVIGNPREGESFTEFYILGPDRVAENYPTEYAPSDSGTVIVGIKNHEQRAMDYTMEIRLENRSLPLPENQKYIRLDHNESWEQPVTFTPPVEGNNMKLEFLLFNETEKKCSLQEHTSLDKRHKGDLKIVSTDYPSSETEAGQISLQGIGKTFKTQTDEKNGVLKENVFCRSSCCCNYFCRTVNFYRKGDRGSSSLYAASYYPFSFNNSLKKNGNT